MSIFKRIKQLREPSTWASIAALGALLGPEAEAIIGTAGQTAVAAGAFVAAIFGVIRKEGESDRQS